MRFGFDIDDTLINLREHAFEIYKKKLKQNLSTDVFHALNRVEIHEPFGLTEEEGQELWRNTVEEIFYTDCPAFSGALETLTELHEEGHDIYYITARPKEHGIRTREWMKKKGFPVRDDRFFYGMEDHEKINIIKDLELDYYVDDKPAVLNTLRETPVKLIVKDQSYNQDLDFDRLVDWHDFKRMISR